MKPHAVLVSAEPSELDPWHDYAITSPLLAGVLDEAGLSVDVRVAEGGALPPIADADLLVVNAGAALGQSEATAGREALLAHVEAGRPILAVHTATSAFRAVPEWVGLVGGRWVNGQSTHPPLGPGHVDVGADHPVVRGVGPFDLVDELYVALALEPGSTELASHRLDGHTHPLLWVRTQGASRLVYDALGHDAQSYASPEHRAILRQAARFLMGLDGGPA